MKIKLMSSDSRGLVEQFPTFVEQERIDRERDDRLFRLMVEALKAFEADRLKKEER